MGRSVLNKNMTIIKDSKYIKSKGIALEEIDVNNITRKPKKCKCGFYDKVELEDWDD